MIVLSYVISSGRLSKFFLRVAIIGPKYFAGLSEIVEKYYYLSELGAILNAGSYNWDGRKFAQSFISFFCSSSLRRSKGGPKPNPLWTLSALEARNGKFKI